jgi:hypothetical protein
MENQETTSSVLERKKNNVLTLLETTISNGKGPTLTGISTFVALLTFIYGSAYLYSYYIIGLGIPIFHFIDITEIVQYAISSIFTISFTGILLTGLIYILNHASRSRKRIQFIILRALVILALVPWILIYIYSILVGESYSFFTNILTLRMAQWVLSFVLTLFVSEIIDQNKAFTTHLLFIIIIVFFSLMAFMNANVERIKAELSTKTHGIAVHFDKGLKIKSSTKMRYLGRTKNHLFFKLENEWKRAYSLENETIIDFK